MSEKQINSKAVVLGMLFKVDVANLNAGWTEENVTPLKKIETPDNRRHPYISGQALRRYLRDTLAENVEYDKNGKPLYQFSPEESGTDPKSPILTAGRPDLYIDDDLFGFMRAVRGETRRRESPLRVSAGFGLFPYLGDRDLGTRSALKVTGNAEAGGAIFETEVTNNIFKTTWLLELDRVARWRGYETTDNIDTVRRFQALTPETLMDDEKESHKELQKLLNAVDGNIEKLWATEKDGGLKKDSSDQWKNELFPFICKHQWNIKETDERDDRKIRVKALLRAIKYLTGGARQTRLMIEFVPQFIVYARMNKKVALFLNALQVAVSDGQYHLATNPLKEVLTDYANDIEALIVGLRDGFVVTNKEELKTLGTSALGERSTIVNPQIKSVGEAVDAMITDIQNAQF